MLETWNKGYADTNDYLIKSAIYADSYLYV